MDMDDGDNDDDKDDKDDNSGGDDDGMGNVHAITKSGHKIETLVDNLVIFQRMTSSLNHKNPYGKFYKWSAWKENDIILKVAIIKTKIEISRQMTMIRAIIVRERPERLQRRLIKLVILNQLS